MRISACSVLSMPNVFCKGQEGGEGSRGSVLNTSDSKSTEQVTGGDMFMVGVVNITSSCSDVPTRLLD